MDSNELTLHLQSPAAAAAAQAAAAAADAAAAAAAATEAAAAWQVHKVCAVVVAQPLPCCHMHSACLYMMMGTCCAHQCCVGIT
jgi:hypothetical protein